MDEFTAAKPPLQNLPELPPPPPAPGTPLSISLPPKQKHKRNLQEAHDIDLDDLQARNTQISQDDIENKSNDQPEGEVASPQCDWHLSSMFSGDYPDPFTLPADHFLAQGLITSAVFLEAAGKEIIAKSEKEAARDKAADEKPRNETSPPA